MSEVEPSPASSGKKKGLGALAWIAIGCAGLVVIGAILFSLGGLFMVRKVKHFAEGMEENPAATAAETMVRLNPDLELVESDRDAGTITVRDKKSGEVVTVDYDELSEGRLSLKSEEGEAVSLGIERGEEDEGSAGFTVTTDEGTARFGAGAVAEVPGWVPRYPDLAEAPGGFASTTGDQASGNLFFATSDPPEKVLAFYQAAMEELGLEVTRRSVNAEGESVTMLEATGEDRSLSATVTSQDGKTTVALNFSGPSG